MRAFLAQQVKFFKYFIQCHNLDFSNFRSMPCDNHDRKVTALFYQSFSHYFKLTSVYFALSFCIEKVFLYHYLIYNNFPLLSFIGM